eukprot:TRINITY_DN15071_c0_g1_i1.p1 TRINITY_DN15071_c0_g1~~TRINITY_DN15071_c0_g1_i1.p1  ORF type:complete len:445 (-),score=127.34 TRINITY_DN15071_c0_g1_i1:84-1262(-)
MGLPVSKMMPLVTETMFKTLLRDHVPKKLRKFVNPLDPCDKLIKRHPDCFLGYLLKSFSLRKQNRIKALKLYEEGERIYLENKENYPKLDPFFASKQTIFDYCDERVDFNELIPNKIYTVEAPCKLGAGDPFRIQSTIYVLNNDDPSQRNKLLIINPTIYNQEMQDKINELGDVDAIITTCSGHGYSLRETSKIWTDAKLIGTSPQNNHDQPTIKFDHFLTDNDDYFGSELQAIKLNGHQFNEVVFYSPETKSLLGLTDSFIPTKDFLHSDTPFFNKAYGFALGLWRDKYTKPLMMQSYHNLFCTNREDWTTSLQKIQSLDLELVPMGHGGVFREEFKDHLQELLDDNLLDDKKHKWSSIEKIYIPLAFLFKNGLVFPSIAIIIGQITGMEK